MMMMIFLNKQKSQCFPAGHTEPTFPFQQGWFGGRWRGRASRWVAKLITLTLLVAPAILDS